MSTKLSEHFTLEEMTKSATAQKRHIDNTPNEEETARLTYLCHELLEPLRTFIQQPITVTSGFRSKQLNKAVGGAKNSYHQYGMAADIAVNGQKSAEIMAMFLLKLPAADQIIYEQKNGSIWLHIGWSYKPRHQFLKIIK